MEKYWYDEKNGKLEPAVGRKTDADEKEAAVFLMDAGEFSEHVGQLPGKKSFLHSMEPVQYCKIEKYKGCIYGTMRVPKAKKGRLHFYRFGFYLSGRKLYFVGETQFLAEYLDKMTGNSYEGCSLRRILLVVLERLLQEDVLYLQKQEQHLAELEEELLRKIPEYFYEMIMKYRKRFNLFHAYYEQLINMGDTMRTIANTDLSAEEREQWQLFSDRAERLHDHVEMLREYLVQIRDLYQSLIAVQQNKVMSILTVVTTIFLPLTLIAGWYGMNFPNMPEFGWKYAYPAVIIVSVTVIVLEILYFKKKKMF